MRILKWCVVLLVALAADAKAFELDPACNEYYQMIQQPGLTYEDVGRIAEAMYHGQCWPVMQGLLPDIAPQSMENGVRSVGYSCESLADSLSTNETILKLFQVRPIVTSDCDIDTENPTREQFMMLLSGVEPSQLLNDEILMTKEECHLLLSNPRELGTRRPDIGLRPINCRGSVVYSDGSKAAMYFWMEQYPDGDTSVWGVDIAGW